MEHLNTSSSSRLLISERFGAQAHRAGENAAMLPICFSLVFSRKTIYEETQQSGADFM